MAPIPTPSSSIIPSRATVALATNQRLVASWLPPRTGSADSAAPTEQEKEREGQLEDELFTPAPELLGFGAAAPKEGAGSRKEGAAGDEKLRKELLGRDYLRKKMAGGKRKRGDGGVGVGVGTGGSARDGAGVGGWGRKPRPAPAEREVDGGSEDEEGGRSSVGKSKLGVRKRRRELGDDGVQAKDGVLEEPERPVVQELEVRAGVVKRGGGYLDEVLADRLKKKRKKSKSKGGDRES